MLFSFAFGAVLISFRRGWYASDLIHGFWISAKWDIRPNSIGSHDIQPIGVLPKVLQPNDIQANNATFSILFMIYRLLYIDFMFKIHSAALFPQWTEFVVYGQSPRMRPSAQIRAFWVTLSDNNHREFAKRNHTIMTMISCRFHQFSELTWNENRQYHDNISAHH